MECQICYYKYTSKMGQKYTCTECSESACTCCVLKHMMVNLGDVRCLFCDTRILITDLRDYLSVSKYKKIKDKQADYLFQIEIGLLDDTKVALKEEQRMIEMNIMIKWMRKDGMTDTHIFNVLTEMGYMKKRSDKHLDLVHMCPKCNNLLNHSNVGSNTYACDSCKSQICIICIEEKKPDHVCDEKVLKTLSHIHNTCETCPKCHAVIEKESGGCDQMFCTKCNTTFSWTTRRILTKNEVRHNPHFYDWQRQQKNGVQRNPLDNPCEGHFLMKCQNDLNEITIIPESLASATLTKINYDKKTILSVDKGMYLKFVQGMLIHSIETIMGIQERDDFIRQQFRSRYLNKRINFKKWKLRFKQHVNTLHRNNETKDLLLTCLDGLYYIVLSRDADTGMIEQLFNFITISLKDVQDYYGRTINYIISANNVILPYMT